MSVVEDVRQVVQDFLAPELRALKVELDAQRKISESSFKLVDTRLDAIEQKIDTRLDGIEQKIQHLIDSLSIDRRLTKLEAQQPSTPQ